MFVLKSNEKYQNIFCEVFITNETYNFLILLPLRRVNLTCKILKTTYAKLFKVI